MKNLYPIFLRDGEDSNLYNELWEQFQKNPTPEEFQHCLNVAQIKTGILEMVNPYKAKFYSGEENEE